MPSGRILWVGGQQADHRVLEAAVKGAGFADVSFASPPEALELIKARSIDLLLLDVNQSSVDVLALISAAGARNGSAARIPVIVTGSPAGANRIQACLERGADEFLNTPFDAKNPLLIARRIELTLKRTKRDYAVRVESTTTGDPNETAILQLITDASSRFVPREFLENLERKSLSDVQLGDHVQRAMTVFFSDIRDFTSLSEQLTPQQNFNFLNSYLRHVNPIIRAHGGFIDKYIGDAIMALFAKEGDGSILAALDLQQQVVRYNLGRQAAGYVPIRIGIGIHRGDLILGTIGENERMQTTVIADAVNVASRIEGLTKTFGVSLLVSGSVVDTLPPSHRFKLRNLGAVKAKGKTQSVELYECYQNDSDDLAEHKDKTAEAFAAAMGEFRKGTFLTAGRVFSRIAEMHPGDLPAAYYRDRCSLTVVRERGTGRWDGAEKIEVK